MARSVVNEFYKIGDIVGQHHLLEQSPERLHHSCAHPLVSHLRLAVKLGQELQRALNGSGNHLRKEGYLERVLPQVLLRRYPAPVDLNGVAHRLKGVKGKSDRQDDCQQRWVVLQTKEMARAAEGAGEKVEIFENDQESQIAKQTQAQVKTAAPHPLRFLYLEAGHVVDQRDSPDDKDVPRAPAHVEVVAGDEQDDSARSAAGEEKKQPHNNEKEQELKAIEEHGECPSAAETTP